MQREPPALKKLGRKKLQTGARAGLDSHLSSFKAMVP
jgi:hypothetical protein